MAAALYSEASVTTFETKRHHNPHDRSQSTCERWFKIGATGTQNGVTISLAPFLHYKFKGGFHLPQPPLARCAMQVRTCP